MREGEEERGEDVKVVESRGFLVRSRKERDGKVERRMFTCVCVCVCVREQVSKYMFKLISYVKLNLKLHKNHNT